MKELVRSAFTSDDAVFDRVEIGAFLQTGKMGLARVPTPAATIKAYQTVAQDVLETLVKDGGLTRDRQIGYYRRAPKP